MKYSVFFVPWNILIGKDNRYGKETKIWHRRKTARRQTTGRPTLLSKAPTTNLAKTNAEILEKFGQENACFVIMTWYIPHEGHWCLRLNKIHYVNPVLVEFMEEAIYLWACLTMEKTIFVNAQSVILQSNAKLLANTQNIKFYKHIKINRYVLNVVIKNNPKH